MVIWDDRTSSNLYSWNVTNSSMVTLHFSVVIYTIHALKQNPTFAGIEILTGLIKSSTADVTSEAFQSLKSFLGRTVVSLLSVEDIRALKPQYVTSLHCLRLMPQQ
jgi:plastocyanin domain-containing protein